MLEFLTSGSFLERCGTASGLVQARGGQFNFVCTGVCGHTIGKLTHPQTNR